MQADSGAVRVRTFTFRLPFSVGITDSYVYLPIDDAYADDTETDLAPFFGVQFWSREGSPPEIPERGMADAVNHFFGESADLRLDRLPGYGAEKVFLEQWLTVYTPDVLLESEDIEDKAFAFHRCLRHLNNFLSAWSLAYDDSAARPVVPNDLGMVVLTGLLDNSDSWTLDRFIFMHPENWPEADVKLRSPDERLNAAGLARSTAHPFMHAEEWYRRAARALHQRGDCTESVIAIQTSAELLFYNLWRTLLVDLGQSSSEINAETDADVPYKKVLTKALPPLLGGDWSLTNGTSPVSMYWTSVYLLRNRVVHSGYEPSRLEADRAVRDFLVVRDFVTERLLRKSRSFPRTLMAKAGGIEGLTRRGWLNERLRSQAQALMSEPLPFYWPHDLAGRRQA